MGVISHSFPWTQQPQVPCTLNRNNPLSKGLLFAVNNAVQCNEIVTGTKLIQRGKTQAYKSGIGPDIAPSAGSDIIYESPGATVIALNECTISCVLDVNTFVNNSTSIPYTTFGGQTGFFQNPFSAGSVVRLVLYAYPDYSGQTDVYADLAALSSKLVVVHGVFIKNTLAKIYLNGIEAGNNSSVMNFPANFTAINTYQWITGFASIGETRSASNLGTFLWNRVLTDPELKNHAANPWQLFS